MPLLIKDNQRVLVNNINQGENNVLRQIQENGRRGQVRLQQSPESAFSSTTAAEKSAALGDLVKFGQNSKGLNGDGVFLRGDTVRGNGKWDVNPQVNDLFDKAKISKSSYIELNKTPEESRRFFDAITKAKQRLGDVGEQVYIYSPEEYQNMKLFLSEDGFSGIAVKPDGDIVSVFANPDAKDFFKQWKTCETILLLVRCLVLAWVLRCR